jgi:hypothetical protein
MICDHMPSHIDHNAVTSDTSSLQIASYDAARKRPVGIATGVLVSVLIHAALLLATWKGRAPQRIEAGPHVISVWLQAPSPVVLPTAPVPPAPSPGKHAVAAREHTAAPKALIALPQPAREPSPNSFAVQPAPAEPPRFDPDAARKLARSLANTSDPARAATAVGQLDTHPLYPEETDTKLARDIASAKRANCLDGKNASLLTPLSWLFDKKGSGCKF